MGIELPSLHDKTIPEPIVPLLYQSTKGLAFQTLGLISKITGKALFTFVKVVVFKGCCLLRWCL